MNIINAFIQEYGVQILYTILMAIASYVGLKVKSIYEKYVNDKEKRDVVETCVKATEQIYKDLHGEEKYNKAVESITEVLNEKGITITDIEIKMLIESTCQSFIKEISNAKEEK